MRIVGGKFKGLHLATPSDQATRPTSDRVREAVFNILAHGIAGLELEGARVLDLFAGTGALGFEALSRGARYCQFVDESAEARGLVRQFFVDHETHVETDSIVPLGYPVPGVDVLIVDEAGHAVARGAVGEIAVESAFHVRFTMPEITSLRNLGEIRALLLRKGALVETAEDERKIA
mgnify:CR=1 FL=1